MDEWKYQQRRRKRHDWCLISTHDSITGLPIGILCGCGTRLPPSKRKKTRIIKRELKRQLYDELYREYT